ncbi:MAG TPA: hypothetical protein VLM76_02025 [Patescibacteria group bacterium]|nr:hypothetical protein [Patescibacteria group bacterium]
MTRARQPATVAEEPTEEADPDVPAAWETLDDETRAAALAGDAEALAVFRAALAVEATG